MNHKESFVLGCKLFGIYCIFLSLPNFVAAILTFFTPGMGGEYAKYVYLTAVVTKVIPIIYLILGIYLLKNGTLIHNYAYPDDEEYNSSNIHEHFILFLKFLGMYLIITSFPDLLRAISSYLTYTNAPEVFMFSKEKQFTFINFLPSAGGLALGFYLLKSGKFFLKIGFRNDEPEIN